MSSGPQDGLSLILYLENSQMDDDPMDYDTFSALGMYSFNNTCYCASNIAAVLVTKSPNEFH